MVKSRQCDICIPVYNRFTYVRDCLDALLADTSKVMNHIYLIDDGSDAFTRDRLQEYARLHDQISIHRNEANLGFVKSCNLGIGLGRAPYIVLLNTDVVVTPEWLDRLVRCAESDERIAFVNPLTNYAAQINVPILSGANFLGMNEALQNVDRLLYPDVVTGVGFCMMIRRRALDEVGVFDEIYGRGYCEESDLCMRLTSRGYRTVVADDVYVYHKGRGTFVDREAHYTHNRRIFDGRWKSEYERQFQAFRKTDPLGPIRNRFRLPQRWDPMPVVWMTARSALDHWRSGQYSAACRALASGAWRALRAQRDRPSPASVSRVTRMGRLRVTYVLHDLLVAGGVLSVIQLVNELILLGVEARIVALYADPVVPDWTRLYTQPIIFRNQQELIEQFPESDIVVATLWRTVPWVEQVVQQGRATRMVYFIQDFEPWFYKEEQVKERRVVLDMYQRIIHRIVKSDWLKDQLADEGFDTFKIPLGMDLGRFYPREVLSDKPTIIAMARPQTPRRGFQTTIDALFRVKQTIPETKIILFGDRFLRRNKIPFTYRDAGVVTDQEQMAALYSEADVFLDGSDFQGFGRCALEAMACDTACVLTNVGGVNEYARDHENALLVPPGKQDMMADQMITLLQNSALRYKLVACGRETASQYDHKREARETLAYFTKIYGKEHLG